MKTSSRNFAVVVGAAAVALLFVPMGAEAVELYSDGCRAVSCLHISAPPPPPPPKVVYTPVVHVVEQPVTVVVEKTTTKQRVMEHTVLRERVTPPKKKAKVDVEIGGGMGMWIVPKLREKVNLAQSARLSLSVKQVMVTMSFNWVSNIRWDSSLSEESCRGNLALIGMGFGYRWNREGHFHPEVGIKFDALALDRHGSKMVFAFGFGGTVGAVASFPLPYGSLIGGLQAEGHYHIWHQNGFFPPKTTAAILALVGYRFQ